jgi:hypothetical protein
MSTITRFPTDYTTGRGAEKLKARLELYWKAQGYPPPTLRVEAMPRAKSHSGDKLWQVRSDMKNGLPSNG